jgi:hypothetical protein
MQSMDTVGTVAPETSADLLAAAAQQELWGSSRIARTSDQESRYSGNRRRPRDVEAGSPS